MDGSIGSTLACGSKHPSSNFKLKTQEREMIYSHKKGIILSTRQISMNEFSELTELVNKVNVYECK